MATGTAKTSGEANPAGYIERQVNRTRRNVRLVDLLTSLVWLAFGLLTYLLLFALVDHWIVGLSTTARWLGWLALLGGAGYYLAVKVVPLAMRKINPVYAAHAIEEIEPSLKNSLVNFLLLREQPRGMHQAVRNVLQQRAAADLNRVPIDQAVDRSSLIVAGYAFTALFALAAIYKVLSPKDPFQSASRAAAPWAAVDRPSRVRILEVTPGDLEVFQGSTVSIAATVEGSFDEVMLLYSTADGQVADRAVEMKVDQYGLRWGCQLPPSTDGIQQDIVYRIEAGDAVTPSYHLTVSPAPTMQVKQLGYDYPEYTGLTDRMVVRQGDISALEGTQVTIRAAANKPIRSAYIRLFSDDGAPKQLPLEFEGHEAWRTILLELDTDRRGQTYAAYEVGFTTTAGDDSQQSIRHQIEVVPDLSPEVAILSPGKPRVEVPEDSVETIEVRGVDPDFGLTSIGLRAVAGGEDLLSEALFDSVAGESGQQIAKFDFRPRSLGLAAGDRVTYWATAADNRQPEPNRVRTRNYQLVIVPGDSRSETDPSATGRPKPNQGDPRNDADSSDRAEDSGGDSPDDTEGEPTDETSAMPSDSGEEGDENAESGEEAGDMPGGVEQPGGEGEAQQTEQEGGSEAAGGAGQESTGDSQGQQQSSGGGNSGDGESSSDAGGGGSRREEPHDGEVFEEALKRIQEAREASDEQGAGEPTDGEQQDASGRGAEQQSPAGGNTGDAQGTRDEQTSSTGQSGDKPEMGDAKKRKPGQDDPQHKGEGAQHPDSNQGAGKQEEGAPGEGGASVQDQPEVDRGDKPKPDGPRDMRKKDPGSSNNGDSGAGQNSKETTGTGSNEDTQQNNTDTKKMSQNPDSSEPQDKDAPGFSKDKKQSDSTGQNSGDRSGGGKKGPGQGANQAGNDSAGQNSSSDDGAGASTESGDGDTSTGPGQKQVAEGETGSAGEQPGSGSSSRSNPDGDQSGKAPQSAQPQGADSSEKRQPSQSQTGDGSAPNGRSGVPTGGGLPSDNTNNDGPVDMSDVPPGEDPNLEYAKRATDMVLDYLKDQEANPDEKLLDKLGWTPEQLSRFLDRWQELKQDATRDSATRNELDETLRSLGLRPPTRRIRRGGPQQDALHGLRETGTRTEPPASYLEQFNAFKKGTSRSAE